MTPITTNRYSLEIISNTLIICKITMAIVIIVMMGLLLTLLIVIVITIIIITVALRSPLERIQKVR